MNWDFFKITFGPNSPSPVLPEQLQEERKEQCVRCSQWVEDWVDTEQTKGRCCRPCETIICQEASGLKEAEADNVSAVLQKKRQLQRYSFDDVKDAWINGKENERQYGGTTEDAPDFYSWLNERLAPSVGHASTQGAALLSENPALPVNEELISKSLAVQPRKEGDATCHIQQAAHAIAVQSPDSSSAEPSVQPAWDSADPAPASPALLPWTVEKEGDIIRLNFGSHQNYATMNGKSGDFFQMIADEHNAVLLPQEKKNLGGKEA